jgi:hypothetical protein
LPRRREDSGQLNRLLIVDRNSVLRKENTVEDQDRTPDEELDVEGHALDEAQELLKKDEDDDFEGHALRDVEETQEALRGDKETQETL